MDDKSLFAERLSGTGFHPPTVVLGKDCAGNLERYLDEAEALFDDSALWFVKHRRKGGGSEVHCVHGRSGASALLKALNDPQDYILQANVRSRLLAGRKCSLRCYGVFYKRRVFYLPGAILVKVHGRAYSETSTHAEIHSLCCHFHEGVQVLSGQELFAELSSTAGGRGCDGQGLQGPCCADEVHAVASQVLALFKDEAALVPEGEYCLIGLDLLLRDMEEAGCSRGAICIEANYPCAINERRGSPAAAVKTQMRRDLKLLLAGDEEKSGFLAIT